MHQLRVRRLVLVAVLIMALLPGGGVAAPWQWSLSAGVARPTIDVSADIEDHGRTLIAVHIDEELRDTDVTGRVRLEGRAGRHGLAIDATRWGLEREERATLLGFFDSVASASVEVTQIDVTGLYNRSADAKGLSLFYGLRLLHAEQKARIRFSCPTCIPLPIQLPILPDVDYEFSEDLVDGLVGARFRQPFAGRWSFETRAAVSGGSTKLSWDAEAGFGVAFGENRRYALRAGYRYLAMEFDAHSGSARIDSTIKTYGPELAFVVSW